MLLNDLSRAMNRFSVCCYFCLFWTGQATDRGSQAKLDGNCKQKKLHLSLSNQMLLVLFNFAAHYPCQLYQKKQNIKERECFCFCLYRVPFITSAVESNIVRITVSVMLFLSSIQLNFSQLYLIRNASLHLKDKTWSFSWFYLILVLGMMQS